MPEHASIQLDRVRILLRTNLFSTPEIFPNLPATVAIIDGKLLDRQGGILVRADGFFDGQGKPVDAQPCTIWVPSGKIDHAVGLES
ncbi:MAG: hypothetical protein GXP62_06065 [Oligoflexia bacterium]|nr:hypothetical protein [Oligoflexia bacterium]